MRRDSNEGQAGERGHRTRRGAPRPAPNERGARGSE
jgi:hypothetical protein